jgi:hypothetical protein
MLANLLLEAVASSAGSFAAGGVAANDQIKDR